MRGRSVLNTFAYTGSLGVAAMAGGAVRVTQTDRNRQFPEPRQGLVFAQRLPDPQSRLRHAGLLPCRCPLQKHQTALRLRHHRSALLLHHLARQSGPGPRERTAHQQGPPAGERRRAAHRGQQRPVRQREPEYMRTLEELCRDGYLSIRN
ncbi:MAG: class I SAM-dependent methyltransferase [Desulfobacterales bacterium]|nr:class I SAM-dependent methyltransferase [Desulfobacterales bacterium]